MNSTTTSFGDMYCENNNISYDNDSYCYYHESNSEMDQDFQEEMEDDYYKSYDTQMADLVAEADYQDYYYSQPDEEYIEEDEYDGYQPEKSNYDYRTDSLLSLVVGVQSYLSEQPNTSERNSPLYSLQYKMYAYMRQRALELGVQF